MLSLSCMTHQQESDIPQSDEDNLGARIDKWTYPLVRVRAISPWKKQRSFPSVPYEILETDLSFCYSRCLHCMSYWRMLKRAGPTRASLVHMQHLASTSDRPALVS